MVKLVLHIEFQDFDYQDVLLQMDSPVLPSGVVWQEGMYFKPTYQEDICYEVGSIWVLPDGKTEVHFFVKYDKIFAKEDMIKYSEEGWTPYSGWE